MTNRRSVQGLTENACIEDSKEPEAIGNEIQKKLRPNPFFSTVNFSIHDGSSFGGDIVITFMNS